MKGQASRASHSQGLSCGRLGRTSCGKKDPDGDRSWGSAGEDLVPGRALERLTGAGDQRKVTHKPSGMLWARGPYFSY